MSWEIVLKNEDEYTRLYTKAIELTEHRDELINELENTTPFHMRADIQEAIVAVDKEILNIYLEMAEKYGHQERYERLGDER